MGEHTIREVLKRRSDDTQRVIRRRRERATEKTHTRRRPYATLVILAVIVLIIAVIIYAGWMASKVDERFTSDRSANTAGRNGLILDLQSTTQFLPNTLLAATDPNFYNNSNLTVSPLTARLVRMYYPDDSGLAVTVKAVALQYGYSRTQILETFINDINLGMNAGKPIRGFAPASQIYFKQPFAQLQPQDVALLVALAIDPDDADPRSDPGKALAMRNAVLQMDAQQAVLSPAQVDALKKSPLDLAPR